MQELTTQIDKKLIDSSATIKELRKGGWEDLDNERKAFAYKYIESYDHCEAAAAIGKKRGDGLKLLRDPLVCAFLSDLQEAMGERSIIKRDFINVQWLKLLPKLMGEEEVMLGVDKDGLQLEGYKFHSADATRALTELSKSTNFYADGTGNGNVSININLAALGIDEDKGVTIEGDYSA